MEYEFKSMMQFLKDQRENKIPKFIFYALNNGTLEIRGPETDKRLYKIYYRRYPNQVSKTKVLKEILPGMTLKDSNGEPVIKGKQYQTRPNTHISKPNSHQAPVKEEPKVVKEDEKADKDKTDQLFNRKYNKTTDKPKERPRIHPEKPKSDEPKKMGHPRKNPEVFREPKPIGRPRKNPDDKKPIKKKTVKPKVDNRHYDFNDIIIPDNTKKRGPYKRR